MEHLQDQLEEELKEIFICNMSLFLFLNSQNFFTSYLKFSLVAPDESLQPEWMLDFRLILIAKSLN